MLNFPVHPFSQICKINDFELFRILAMLRDYSHNFLNMAFSTYKSCKSFVSLVKVQAFYICWKNTLSKFSQERYIKGAHILFSKKFSAVLIIL